MTITANAFKAINHVRISSHCGQLTLYIGSSIHNIKMAIKTIHVSIVRILGKSIKNIRIKEVSKYAGRDIEGITTLEVDILIGEVGFDNLLVMNLT